MMRSSRRARVGFVQISACLAWLLLATGCGGQSSGTEPLSRDAPADVNEAIDLYLAWARSPGRVGNSESHEKLAIVRQAMEVDWGAACETLVSRFRTCDDELDRFNLLSLVDAFDPELMERVTLDLLECAASGFERSLLSYALPNARGRDLLPYAFECSESQNPSARANAARYLVRFPEATARQVVCDKMRTDPDPGVRANYAIVASDSPIEGDFATVAALAASLGDADATVRMNARFSLMRVVARPEWVKVLHQDYLAAGLEGIRAAWLWDRGPTGEWRLVRHPSNPGDK